MPEVRSVACQRLALPFGHGVWRPLEPAPLEALATGQRRFAAGLPEPRRSRWIAGRLALADACEAAGLGRPDVLATDRGAPAMPPGWSGTVSHCREAAVALVGPLEQGWVGIDVESIHPARPRVAARVLTDEERAAVAALVDPDRRWLAILLRFSLKEAIYKALDPTLRRWIGFHEASCTPRPDGSATVRLALRRGEGPFVLEACWQQRAGCVVTACRVRVARGAI